MVKKLKDWSGLFEMTYTVELTTETHYKADGNLGACSIPVKTKRKLIPKENQILLKTNAETLEDITENNLIVDISGNNDILFDLTKILAYDIKNYKIRFRVSFANWSWYRFSKEAFNLVLDRIGEKHD